MQLWVFHNASTSQDSRRDNGAPQNGHDKDNQNLSERYKCLSERTTSKPQRKMQIQRQKLGEPSEVVRVSGFGRWLMPRQHTKTADGADTWR